MQKALFSETQSIRSGSGNYVRGRDINTVLISAEVL